MEVHKYTDILGMEVGQAVYEGRMVLIQPAGGTSPGTPIAVMPSDAAQAALARYVVAWPVDDRKAPIFQTYPQYSQALRYGFEQATNLPHTTTLWYTWPGLQSHLPQQIPSGTGALLYDKGEYTVTSGHWVYGTDVLPGTELEVEYSGANQGQLKKLASGKAVAVATSVDQTYKTLRFRTYGVDGA